LFFYFDPQQGILKCLWRTITSINWVCKAINW